MNLTDISLVLGLLVFFVAFVHVLLIQDPETSRVAKYVTVTLPQKIESAIHRHFGYFLDKLGAWLSRYAFKVFYLALVLGSWIVIFIHAYPLAFKSAVVSPIHQYIGYALFVVCLRSWYLAVWTSPGYITRETLQTYNHYPFDNFLYVKNRTCPTTGLPRLARSKYDPVSRQQVPRFDHYCFWLHNAIGEENYRTFLAFLVIHVSMCFYGTYMVLKLLKEDGDAHFHPAGWRTTTLLYCLDRHLALLMVVFLMGALGLLLGLFLSFHIYITSRGMTTNEYFKWSRIRQQLNNNETVQEVSVASDETAAVGCVGPDAAVDYHKQKIRNKPSNIYDIGFVENWKQVMFPISLYATMANGGRDKDE